MAVWVVRAGSRGQNEEYALNNNCVVIGWEETGSLQDIDSRESMGRLIDDRYPKQEEATRSNWLSQLWAFKDRIHDGDLVILPLKSTANVAIGVVTGAYRHDAGAPDGANHQRPVRWEKTAVPRTSIGQDMLYSINGAMTAFQITRNNAETRFRSLMMTSRDPGVSSVTDEDSAVAMETDDLGVDIETAAKDKIATFIGKHFKKHDLERLVDNVLQSIGFTTQRTEAGPDGGVDIVAGKGALGLESPRICVQVKSGQYVVDVKDIRQLQGVLAGFGADMGLIVSWGGFTKAAFAEARRAFFKLRLWDSGELVKTILENYGKLSDEIQAEIPLTRIWTLVESDSNDS